jgi:hypothetical protein
MIEAASRDAVENETRIFADIRRFNPLHKIMDVRGHPRTAPWVRRPITVLAPIARRDRAVGVTTEPKYEWPLL